MLLYSRAKRGWRVSSYSDIAELDNEAGRTSIVVCFRFFSSLNRNEFYFNSPFLANKHQLDGEQPVFVLVHWVLNQVEPQSCGL